MAQTLDAVALDPSMTDSSVTPYAVLVTDGWQWCDPYDPSTRFAPVDAVARRAEREPRCVLKEAGRHAPHPSQRKKFATASTTTAMAVPMKSMLRIPTDFVDPAPPAMESASTVGLNTPAAVAAARRRRPMVLHPDSARF